MSIKTFKDEFYPVPAHEATGSDKEAAAHSKRKWEGFRKENLERHGLGRTYDWDSEINDVKGNKFWFDGDTCALCLRHIECIDCPVREADRECGNQGSAYQEALDTGNPERLIQILGAIAEGKE